MLLLVCIEMAYTTPLTTSIPFTSNSAADEGTVELSYHRDYSTYKGLFSFVLYFRGPIELLKISKYYFGIKSYIDFTHNTSDDRLRDFFKDVGIIIYTDPYCSQMMKDVFGSYEKVIIATVNWPRYMIGLEGVLPRIPGTLLRIMRFQATEAFPNSYICVRDADTIFPMEIKFTISVNNGIIHINKRHDGRLVFPNNGLITTENVDQLVADRIGNWEKTFIEQWMTVPESMFFGMGGDSYTRNWHRNIPVTLNIDHNTAVNISSTSRILDKKLYSEQLGSASNNIKAALDQARNPFILTYKFLYGIYAGFVNFKVSRPRNLWTMVVGYIISRNPLITYKRDKTLESEYWQTALKIDYDVGNDERALIFAIAAQYPNDILFGNILYYNNPWPDFFTEENRESLLNIKYMLQYNKSELIEIIPGLLLKYNGDNGTGKLPIYSKQFHPDTIPDIFASATPELQSKVHNALAEYNKWLNSIKSMSNSNFQPFSNKFKGLAGYPLKRTTGGKRRTQRRFKLSMKRRRGRG
jgi:hypothetical protein